jgi:uncharacterized protein (DUF305 family)
MKRAFALLCVPVAAFGLAACGGKQYETATMPGHSSTDVSSSASASASSQHNDADLSFAQTMIGHQQQAVEMAKLAPVHASMPEVKNVASSIEGAQGPEIATMSGWLKTWGVATPTMSGRVPMNPGEGTLGQAEMNRLASISGTDFDKTFLEMMIKHHQGAISMAKTEQAQGQFADAKALAEHIVTSQTDEITKMKSLLEGMKR